jgi:hypothetical protein
MSDERPDTVAEDDESGDFYAPATFQFSTDSGNVERVLVGLFEERGEIEARAVSDEESPEFFMPAMFQFSKDSGRIQRFLESVFKERGETVSKPVPEELRDDLYLPASNPDEHQEQTE